MGTSNKGHCIHFDRMIATIDSAAANGWPDAGGIHSPAGRDWAKKWKTQMIDLHEFRARVENTVADLNRDIALMESGQIKMKSKNGDEPWRDVTQESIARNKLIVSTHELILAGVDKR